ncbi:hypothetical protein P9112_011952 [Eukaryota sp. TZLM1-RC]
MSTDSVHISSLTLKNFRCHDHFTIDFTPAVNIITGRNGSGKSSVLNALTLLFGCSERRHHSSTTLADYINSKNPNCQAELHCIITLPTDHPLFHQCDGSVSLNKKISKNVNGALQTTTLRGGNIHLTRICDIKNFLFNKLSIDFSSPLQMLSQDDMKIFVSNDGKDLFSFIAKASQLRSMEARLEQAAKLKEEAVPGRILHCRRQCRRLKEESDLEVEKLLSMSDLARNRRLLEFKQMELDIVSYLIEQENVLEKQLAYDDMVGKLHQLQEDCPVVSDELKENLDVAFKERDEINSKLVEINSEIIQLKEELNREHSLLTGEKQSLSMSCQRLDQYESSHAELSQQLDNLQAQNFDERAIELNQELEKSLKDFSSLQENQSNLIAECELQNSQYQVAVEELHSTREELNNVSSEIFGLSQKRDTLLSEQSEVEQKLQSFRSADLMDDRLSIDELWPYPSKDLASVKRFLAPLGQNAESFLTELTSSKQRNLFKQPVFGPIGCFFNVNDPNFLHSASLAFSNLVNSFLVQNSHDLELLLKISRRHFRSLRIMTYSNKEKIILNSQICLNINGFSNVARADTVIEFVYHDYINDFVDLNLIYNSFIERVVPYKKFFASDANALKTVMYDSQEHKRIGKFEGSCRDWTCSKVGSGNISKFPTSDRVVLLALKRASREENSEEREAEFNQKLIEIKSDVARLNDRLLNMERAKESLSGDLEVKQDFAHKLKKGYAKIKREIDNTDSQKRELQLRIDNLREELSEFSQDFIDNMIKQTQKKLDELNSSIIKEKSNMEESNSNIQKLELDVMSRKDTILLHENAFAELKASFEEKNAIFEAFKTEINKVKEQIAVHLSKISQLSDQIHSAEIILTELSAKLAEKLDFLTCHCPGIDFSNYSPQDKSDIENEINSLFISIERGESQFNISFAEQSQITEHCLLEYNDMTSRFLSVKEQSIEFSEQCVTADRNYNKWKEYVFTTFRNRFSENLQVMKKNAFAFAEINLKSESISLFVDTGRGPLEVSNLSGGERSVTTIAFLKACSAVLVHPIKCLDEFDVYQDSYHRNLTFDHLIRAGLDKKDNRYVHQTILITPNEFVVPEEISHEVKIHSLRPPERR